MMNRKLPLLLIFTGLFLACNTSSVKEKGREDSLQYYPPTPVPLEQKEFRRLYREIAAFFDSTLLRSGFNGAILVAREGQVIYEKYLGKTDLKKGDTITASTPFHIASTSKTFTAMATLRLVQEGRLSLDDTLGRFFPGFPYYGINIRMLLSHRSGLPNYLYFMSNNKWGIGPDGKWNRRLASNRDMLNMLVETRPNITGRPGGKFNYSNTNYTLLALIIEEVSGKSYPEYMKEKIFDPLGMHDTHVFVQADTLTALHSYTAGGVLWGHDFLDATYGDKNIYTTPRDLLKWDQAFYTQQFLEQPLLDSAFAPYSLDRPSIHNYGLGWRLLLLPNGKKVIYHFGKWHGFNAAFARLTDEKATIIILGNRFNRNIYNSAHLCYDIFGDYRLQKQTEGDDSPEAAEKPQAPKKAKAYPPSRSPKKKS